LLTNDPAQLPRPLGQYLLDVQPGYERDPVRGVYNHGWLIGDDEAISAAQQAEIDALLEIVPVQRGGAGSGNTPAQKNPKGAGRKTTPTTTTPSKTTSTPAKTTTSTPSKTTSTPAKTTTSTPSKTTSTPAKKTPSHTKTSTTP